MAYCKKCGKFVTDGSNFCTNCGSPIECETPSQKRQEFAGKVIKCPSCGAELPSFTAICPGCGHEINSATISSAIKDFINQLNQCDSSITRSRTKSEKDWKVCGYILLFIFSFYTVGITLVIYLLIKFLGLEGFFSFSPEEKRKENIINNFVVPNDRGNILEGLLFIKSQVEAISSNRIGFNTVRWINIWQNKASQLYERAEMLFQGDAIATKAYSDILEKKKETEKSLHIRVIIAIAIAITYITVIVLLVISRH